MRRRAAFAAGLLLLAGCPLPPPAPEERPPLDRFSTAAGEERFRGLMAAAVEPGERLAGLSALLAEEPRNFLVAWALADLGRDQGQAAAVEPRLRELPAPFRQTALARLTADEGARGELLAEALAADRDFYPALYLAGRLALEQGRLEAADRELRRCLGVRPAWPPALFEVARLRLAQSQPREATQALDEYLQARPGDRPARLLRARLLIQPLAELGAAQRELDRLEAERPGDPQAALLAAGLLAVRGRNQEAAAAFAALLGEPAVRALAAFNLGFLRLKRLRDPEGARAALGVFLGETGGASLADLVDRLRARTWCLQLEEKGVAGSRPAGGGGR